ncbi:MAG: GGDEF domain-containing protein [Pseudomonadota bacterium]
MKQTNHGTDEFILIMLSIAGALAVLPFAIIRYMNGEWLLYTLDSVLIIGLMALAVFVYRTHRIRFASFAVTLLCLTAIIGTIYIKGISQVFWAFPAVLILFYLLRPVEACLINFVGLAVLAPKLYSSTDALTMMTILMTVGVTIAFSYAFSSLTARQRSQLVRMATRDPLTGANNRRALGQKMHELIAAHRRKPVVASLLLIDLDDFKQINDVFGHAAGDDVLIGVVAVIKQRIRETDTVYRIGGEEFLIIAEGANNAVANKLAEDLRCVVEKARLVESRVVTISVGIAQLVDGETTDDWLRRADKALYSAKDAGRNTTVSAPMLSEHDVSRLDAERAAS